VLFFYDELNIKRKEVIMNVLTKGIIKEAKDAIYRLRKFCHHEDCRYPVHSCPDDESKHPLCQKKLGLDTAVAWEMADTLQAMLSLAGYFDNETPCPNASKKEFIDLLARDKDSIMSNLSVTYMLFRVSYRHKFKHEELYSIMLNAKNISMYIVSRVQDAYLEEIKKQGGGMTWIE
jgi:hypothetical protein